jgi:hypothetical protein
MSIVGTIVDYAEKENTDYYIGKKVEELDFKEYC